MKLHNQIPHGLGVCFLAASLVPAHATVWMYELRPRPFSSETNYMSLSGYYRYQELNETGQWPKRQYNFAPVELRVGGNGSDPSVGEIEAWERFRSALKEYPNRVLFVIRWTCQAPEPGEGPMRDWEFYICGNRFLDTLPDGQLKPYMQLGK